MDEKRSIAVHFKRAVTVNFLLFLYCVSPSVSCFITLTIGFLVAVTDSPYETLQNLLACKKGNCNGTETINELYNKFTKFTIIQQVLIMVGFKLLNEVAWYFPTWIIIFIVAEIFATWTLLEDFAILELIKEYLGKAHEAMLKVHAMIPKYTSE